MHRGVQVINKTSNPENELYPLTNDLSTFYKCKSEIAPPSSLQCIIISFLEIACFLHYASGFIKCRFACEHKCKKLRDSGGEIWFSELLLSIIFIALTSRGQVYNVFCSSYSIPSVCELIAFLHFFALFRAFENLNWFNLMKALRWCFTNKDLYLQSKTRSPNNYNS